MNVQFLTNERGENTHAVIPIKLWNKIQRDLQKQKLKESLTLAFKEVKLAEEGKIGLASIDELFK
ncbi:hypothetical protein [Dyadobacter sp. CY347]|uniref:hypothetical protein n=1 Tax=Dyadobacter sp. CY347 TaxID=2909336 RepID=UPI001F2421E6|nr:hypothetical protein [Dyadobacter sp. CY347]MCF2490900.1 hypothetical protein [Dyadobacter sp. CY347]